MSYVFFETSFLEYPDKESLALVVSFSGCPHHCNNCHSPLSQEYVQDAEEYTNQEIVMQKYYLMDSDDIIKNIKKLCHRNNTNKIVISGGDPLSHFNIDTIKDIIIETGNYDLCIYTGYKPNEVLDLLLEYPLDNIIFKCGSFHNNEYVEPNKNDEYMQLASTNQNFYKIKNNKIEQLSENGKLIFKGE